MNPRTFLTGILLTFMILNVDAQDVSKRWGVGLGIGLKDYENLPVNGSFNFNAFSPAIYGHLGRVLAPSWEIQLSGMIPIPNYSYFSPLEPSNQANFHIHYRLNNGYLLKASSGFGPYLTAGLSGNFRDFQDSAYTLSVPVGIGLRLQPAKFVSFHLSGHYHLAAVANRAQPQVSFQTGFTFHLGKSKDIEVKPSKNDQDGDGVKDKKDECPDVAGLTKFKGCPDTDGDGVPDKDDTCADIPGIAANQGCPEGDLDQDGFDGTEDLCPDQAGGLKGCPDSDQDGIADPSDECPQLPGSPGAKGCPDADEDGIPDKNDRCPNEYGLAEYDGCASSPDNPLLFYQEVAAQIKFADNSDQIMPEGVLALDQLAAYLQDNPERRIKISVFTDNDGELYRLYQLSASQGNSCKAYLMSKGIDPSRISIQGYGPFLPIADNFYPERAQFNNRVEISEM